MIMLHQKQIEQLIAKKYHFLTRCEYIHSLFTSKGLKRNLKSQILKHRFFAEADEQIFELVLFQLKAGTYCTCMRTNICGVFYKNIIVESV